MKENNNQNAPSGLVEACGGPPIRPAGLLDVARCIGCILARPEDETPLTPGVVLACGPASRGTVDRSFQKLEENGIIRPSTQRDIKNPPVGRWHLSMAHSFEPTERGRSVLPIQAQEICPIRNPLARATPHQARVINCMRCILARPTENGGEPSFLIDQIMACLGISQSQTRNVVNPLLQASLIERTAAQGWRKGKQPFIYTLTPKGARWMSPQPARGCPAQEVGSLVPKVSPERERVLRCMACLFRASRSGEDVDRLRQTTVAACLGEDSNKSTVQGGFDRLVREAHLEKQPLPNSKRTDYYVATGSGARLFGAIQPPETCPSGRRPPEEPLQPEQEPDDSKGPLFSAMKRLPKTTFVNGAALMKYLQETPYKNETHLHVLTKLIENYASKRIPLATGMNPSDTSQEILLAIFKKKTAITFPDELGYIFGIASNKVADAFRKHLAQKKRTLALGEDAAEVDKLFYKYGPSPESTGLAVDSLDTEALMKGIKPTPLNIALLQAMARGTDGANLIDTEAIAAEHDKTPGAVRVALHRLRTKLRKNEYLRKIWEGRD